MKKKVYFTIMIVLLGVFLYSLYNVYDIYLEYKQGEDTYSNLAGSVSEQEPEATATPDADVDGDGVADAATKLNIGIDFDALKKVNKDVIGWIYSPGTVINYPVVQGTDNSFYLKHLFDKKYNASGTPFLDCNMAADFSDKNHFIYAHHMKNGSMFSSITNYKNKDYYNKHKSLYLVTPKEKYRLDVFSAYITKATSDTYMRGFAENKNFQKYIDYIRGLSLIKTDVKMTIKDKIISLSTCTYEYENARFVVHTKAVKIK